MATLYIAEFSGMSSVPGNAGPQMTMEPPIAQQVVAIGGSSTASAPFNPATRMVRLHCDSICSVAFGVSPVADVTQARMAANQTEYHGVPQGGTPYSVAVIANS